MGASKTKKGVLGHHTDIKMIAVILVAVVGVAVAGWVTIGNHPALGQTGPAVTDGSLAAVKARGVLVVGTYSEIPPMTSLDANGNMVGFEIDMMKEISSRLGVKVQFKDIFFPDLFPAVENGDVDVASSVITITSERSTRYLFSIPYFEGGQVLMIRNDTPGIRSTDDLAGMKVGVVKDSTGEITARSIRSINQSLLVVNDEKNKTLEDMLLDGDIDVLLGDYVVSASLVKDHPNFELVGGPITQEYYGVMTKKDNADLMNAINDQLRDMKRGGELKTLEDRWIG